MNDIRPSVLWSPSPERVAESAMHGFRAAASRRAGRSLEGRSLHEWSVAAPEEMWTLLAEFLGLDLRGPPMGKASAGSWTARWFPEATLNYAERTLGHPNGAATAILAVDDEHRTRAVTHGELREQVRRCANALDVMGVAAGDRVAAYLPNAVEAVVILLASAARGAVFTSCSPTMGIDATLDRFAQVTPKVLFATDGHWSGGKHIVADLARLVAGIPSLEHIVCVPSRAGVATPHPVWDEVLGAAPEAPLRFAPLPFDQPLYILYTSGTTGVPKCLVHGAGGALLTHVKEQRLHCDVRPDDVVFYQTNTGWMMWNWLVSALASRATIVLYAGGLFHPSRDALWRLVDRLAVTHFGTSASHLHSAMRGPLRPRELAPFAALRCVLSTGSPLSPEGFAWVYDSLKPDVHLASISGGTDIVGCFMMGDPTQPVHAGQIQGPALGVDLAAYDDQGRSVKGVPGELVCRAPLPSMPLCFWNDPDDARYREAYFERYPGVWHHGDRIELTAEDGIIVWGRSDATLKPGGVRIGTGEIYRALEGVAEVLEAMAVGKNDGHDTEVWLFVVLKEGVTLERALSQRISNTILKRASAQHVPGSIFQVSDLPRTHSGKLLELAASRVVNGREVDNLAAIANPAALRELARAAGLEENRGGGAGP